MKKITDKLRLDFLQGLVRQAIDKAIRYHSAKKETP